jgi:hypothetical protein
MCRCPHCPKSGTFEEVADHMMDEHGYAGVWQSEIEAEEERGVEPKWSWTHPNG